MSHDTCHDFSLLIRQELVQRARFLRYAVISVVNSLPEAVVTAKTVNAFKSKLNDTWKYHPLKFDV